jgi:hypothetical protein
VMRTAEECEGEEKRKAAFHARADATSSVITTTR